jgi:hypothetical protein
VGPCWARFTPAVLEVGDGYVFDVARDPRRA